MRPLSFGIACRRHRRGRVRARAQCVPELLEPPVHALSFDGGKRHPVTAWGTVVCLRCRVRSPECLQLPHVDGQAPEPPGRFGLRLGVAPPLQVLQPDGRCCPGTPASRVGGGLRTVGSLRSSGMPPPSSLLRTHPPPSRRPPTSRGKLGYRAYPASAAFATGRGRFLALLAMSCVTVPPLPPRRSARRHQSECRQPCCLRPGGKDSAFGIHFSRGRCWVHLRYGPVTRSPPRGRLCQLASSALFPPRMQLKLRGS